MLWEKSVLFKASMIKHFKWTRHICETIPLNGNQAKDKSCIKVSKSQCHWPWCHFEGFHRYIMTSYIWHVCHTLYPEIFPWISFFTYCRTGDRILLRPPPCIYSRDIIFAFCHILLYHSSNSNYCWGLFSGLQALANLRQNKVLTNKKRFTVVHNLPEIAQNIHSKNTHYYKSALTTLELVKIDLSRKRTHLLNILALISRYEKFPIHSNSKTRVVTVIWCANGFISRIKKLKCKKNTKRVKFQDYNICPNILHVYSDVDAGV